jgi:multiple sugar transport system substrate-binding protein
VADFQDWGAVKQLFDDVFVEMVLNGDGTVDQAFLDAKQAELEALRK